jgi:uncharacterized protein (UPF0248 family)
MARTARDVLNELRWREGEALEDAVLFVRDRVVKERFRAILGNEITKLDHATFETAGATIPYYKIDRIEYRGEVIFERTE